MLFLKKFKAVGFKSFANNINLDFNNSIVGIVGPNGSGKSNIVDAIKWVMGEKSNKSLRGKIGSDIIFHGSNDKDGSPFALVSLTFDNSSKILHNDAKEITITRKLSRDLGVNEYFINDKPCKLKDLHDLFLDTGLSRGSLCIISQGTVQRFVESKPEERRKIFEDAAGIGTYIKRKNEALNELVIAKQNFEKINDYVVILEKDILKLSKQVEKAQIYTEKKNQLKNLELSILAKDLSINNAKIIKFKQDIADSISSIQEKETLLENLKKQISLSKNKVDESDKIVEEYSEKFANIVQQINHLEIQNNNLINRLNDDINSSDKKKKLTAFKQIISTFEYDLKSTTDNNQKLINELESYKQIKNDTQIKKENCAVELSNLLVKINDIQYKLRFINEKINNEYTSEIGVKTILENLNVLKGIIGVVKNFITVDQKYEKAISISLGKTANYLISENDEDVKYAINFLKNNKAGKATFLPLTNIKPRKIRVEHELLIKQIDGFINTANNLITYDAKYENVFSMLLGTVLVCQDLNSAIMLSKYTNASYPIVTLGGETIAPGGSITGGYNKTIIESLFNLQDKKDLYSKQLDELIIKQRENQNSLNIIESNLRDIDVKINEKQVIISTNNEKIKNLTNNLYRYKSEYDQIKSNDDESLTKQNINDVTKQLSELNAKKDFISQRLNIAKITKSTNKQIYDDHQAKLEEMRIAIDKLRTIQMKSEIDLNKSQSIINAAKEIISYTYKLTAEIVVSEYNKELQMTDIQARNLIKELKNELDRIGNINMEALEELETKKKEFATISKQHKQLKEAKEKIEKAINELDTNAINSFKQTIQKINEKLPYVFAYLFGGGTCSIEYTNKDDVLNSGIEVIAIPPGKKVTNLNLLSGGEKTLVALSVLFTILNVHLFPLVILDEAESALDPANVERFADIIRKNVKNSQFLVITHRPGTMEKCDCLYGTTMQLKGITNIYKVSLSHAKNEFANDNTNDIA